MGNSTPLPWFKGEKTDKGGELLSSVPGGDGMVCVGFILDVADLNLILEKLNQGAL